MTVNLKVNKLNLRDRINFRRTFTLLVPTDMENTIATLSHTAGTTTDGYMYKLTIKKRAEKTELDMVEFLPYIRGRIISIEAIIVELESGTHIIGKVQPDFSILLLAPIPTLVILAFALTSKNTLESICLWFFLVGMGYTTISLLLQSISRRDAILSTLYEKIYASSTN